MGGDDKKRGSTTKRFTREQLAELAKKARGDEPEPPPAVSSPDAPTPMSRSQTLHDPLTTQVLAEIARRVQAEIEGGEAPVEDDPHETAHPHTRRRRPSG